MRRENEGIEGSAVRCLHMGQGWLVGGRRWQGGRDLRTAVCVVGMGGRTAAVFKEVKRETEKPYQRNGDLSRGSKNEERIDAGDSRAVRI